MARAVHSFLLVGVLVVVAILGGSKAINICNMESSQLMQCLPAIRPPPSAPTPGCCDLIRHANIPCLCSYKPYLPALGIDPTLALQLPKKCNMTDAAECPCVITEFLGRIIVS
ncbi:hypothetical protein IFM89_037269 [Coptis chinensis]|uniref:Bifunctional inhibitor/plant lipid transfer protein/seed storage helical domain-containing protein n=1 Tax=Coptis chinensis TaxID=261450 RepID=A0A835I669_9MAGN|nr:hypothetical protein IFM89_037269 [Coptis chinensis]